jgi:hypothetical protein
MVASLKKEDTMSTLDIKKDLWRSIMFDTATVSPLLYVSERVVARYESDL